MLKLSFKVQLSLIAITIAAVVAIVIHFVNDAAKQTQIALTKAMQTSDYGFQTVSEKAMSTETFSFMIDSLKDISGTTPEGGNYSVFVIKDTISTDSIEVKIESRGEFGKEVHYQSKRILLVSPDSVNWVMSY